MKELRPESLSKRGLRKSCLQEIFAKLDVNIDDGVLSLTVLENTCNEILGLEQVRTPLQVFSSEFVKFLEKLRLFKGKRGELILFNSK